MTRTNKPSARTSRTKAATRARASRPPASAPSALGRAIREGSATATDLPTFLARAHELTPAERTLIVRQALILIEQNYAHLPLKRAMHSVDPVQRLKLLRHALESAPAADQPSEVEFHRELSEIFTSVRDLHTNYLLPAPFDQMTAVLPFAVEDYYANGGRQYVVSHVAEGFTHPTFVPGVDVVSWNGTPIERAVWNVSQRYAGSNREARHARGVQTLTARALRIAPPPDEEWVIVGYRTLAGAVAEHRFAWQVRPSVPLGVDPAAGGDLAAQASLGLDLEQDIVRRMRLALFAPQVVAEAEHAAAAGSGDVAGDDLRSRLPGVFTARPVETPAGRFGYLRIWTFNHWPPQAFVGEFIRLVAALPQTGLIIDVRGNGGGVIMNGELILQTLTPRRIEPEPLQFINTPLNLELCRRNGPGSPWADLSPWVESMRQALLTGSVFSAGFPLTDPEDCNAIGQKYFGPVVLITDALCYSTTDIFAAGFQDHEIGTILGTDGNTGAGGANVWEHRHLARHALPDSVYQDLPGGTGMRVSIRRTLRVGRRAGAPLEDLGVVPDARHFLTRNDLLHGNVDLIDAAAALLSTRPVRTLGVTVRSASSTRATIQVDTRGMTRLDVYVGARPHQSVDIRDGATTLEVPRLAAADSVLELRGFDGAELVARYRTPLEPQSP